MSDVTVSGLNHVLRLSESAESLRLARPEVAHQLDEGYRALYVEDQVLSAAVRHALAAIVARRQGDELLAAHHAAHADPALIGEELPSDPKLRALVEHVDLITVSPALVERDDQLTLQIAGVAPEEIVLASQIVAFTSALVRVAYAYALLGGDRTVAAAPLARPTVAAGRPHRPEERTARGSEIPTRFTREVLEWEPWVAAPGADELTSEQRDSFAAKATTNSEYFRLLSLVPNVLRARSALDNAIFLGEHGLPRGERELAAAVTSKVNDCVYCASVHARKAEFQTKRADDIDRLLGVTLRRDDSWLPERVERLAEGQDERWNTLIRFTARLAQLVPQADTTDVERLEEVGLTREQIADAALATAFFSWANRLMLSLGEPAVPGTATR